MDQTGDLRFPQSGASGLSFARTVVDGDAVRGRLGRLVLLSGGEAGVLTAWRHAEDHSSWPWSVEFADSV